MEETKNEGVEGTKLFFGDKEVSEYGEVPEVNKVWVVYADGAREILHKSEWELRSEAPAVDVRQFDINRSLEVQQKILSVLHAYNVRLFDITDILKRVMWSIDRSVETAAERVFGQEYGIRRIDDIQKVLDLTQEDAKPSSETNVPLV